MAKNVKSKKPKQSPLSPRQLGDHDWFYECPTHMLLIHEIYEGDCYVRTDQIKIPWRKITTRKASVKAGDQ